MKKRYWAVFATTLWLILTLSTIPASWAVYMLQETLSNYWQVAHVSGSLWQGSAQNSRLLIDNKPLSLGEFKWQLSPLGLLRLRPCIKISGRLQRESLVANVCLSMLSRKLWLQNSQLAINVATLEPWLIMRLRGNADILLKSMSIKNGYIEAIDGIITWRQAQFYNGHTWVNLGGVRAHLTDDKAGGLRSQWTDTKKAPFTANLTIQVPNKSSLRISGNVTPKAEAPPVIHETLQIIGKSDRQGGYAIDWRYP